eukprot:Selendium_serpulae@DN5916_c0_g1_i6.p1
MRILIVGSGLSGAVLAREFAEAKHQVTVIDQRDHLGGNCFDFVNQKGERVHKYGPHLLHGSKDTAAVEFISKFSEFVFYEHRVRGLLSDGRTTPIPVNRTTLEDIYGVALGDSTEETEKFFESIRTKIDGPITNSDQVFLSSVGERLANIFFRPYTNKMWGKPASEIEAAVGARIPVRNDRDDRYFDVDFQKLPKHGYTKMFENMFDHEYISVRLSTPYHAGMEMEYDWMFTAMPIDVFFDFEFGELPYRSIKFTDKEQKEDLKANTINFTDDGPFTRMTQWDTLPNSEKSNTGMATITYETPCDPKDNNGERYYPVRNSESLKLYDKYLKKSEALGNVTFCGRTGLFKYLDMLQAVHIHLDMAKKFLMIH